MGLYRKKNIVIGAIGRMLVPESLWTRRFLFTWLGCLVTVLLFDVLWCAQTTFRGMGFAGTYINALSFSVLMSFPVVVSRRWWPQITLMGVVDLLLIANLMYCRTYFNNIPLTSYGLVGNVADFTASIADSFSWVYLVLPAVTVVTFLLITSGDEDERRRRPAAVFYLATLGVLMIASAVTALCSGGLRAHVAELRDECYYASTPITIYTLPGVMMADWMQLSHSEQFTDADRKLVSDWGRDHMRFRTMASTHPDSVPRRDNLVVILCESLESWPIGATVEGKELTPVLNSVIADSTTWYAPRVLSQVGNGRSIDGQLLMIAGMYPLRDRVYSMHYPDHTYFTLPKAMRETGARTWLLSGDKPITWNQARIAESFGIDNVHMQDSWDNSERIGHPKKLSDNSLFIQSIAKMQRGDVWPEGEKGYVQILTYTGHNPFIVPDEFKTITFEGDYPEKLRDYMTVAHYTDQSLGRFLDYLRSRSDWDRTMVVIVGDHEGLASWRQELRSGTVGASLVSDGSFVPLVIMNAPHPGRHEAVMGQVDVYSTVLDQMGLAYAWPGMGFSALSPEAPAFAIDYHGLIVGDRAGAPAQLVKHIEQAPGVSDITVRFNLLK